MGLTSPNRRSQRISNISRNFITRLVLIFFNLAWHDLDDHLTVSAIDKTIVPSDGLRSKLGREQLKACRSVVSVCIHDDFLVQIITQNAPFARCFSEKDGFERDFSHSRLAIDILGSNFATVCRIGGFVIVIVL